MNEGTLAIDFIVPSIWPTPAVFKAFAGCAAGSNIEVTITPSGTVSLLIKNASGVHIHETPQLVLPEYAFLKLAFSWGVQGGIRCAVNGIDLSDPSDSPKIIDAKSTPPTGFRSYRTFHVPETCNDIERSLLRFLLDLQSRVSIQDRFNLLEASAILRRLLLDSSPILHLANREYRQKIRFPFVRDREIDTDAKSSFEFANFCPDFADPKDILLLTLDAFLCSEVLRDEIQTFTVRDVVGACANLKGGIHFDSPTSQSEQSLLKLDEEFNPFFIDASLATLPGIAWTVISATMPLVEQILKKHCGEV